jgi:glycosyltransferase involved in cell wall biosynthesis
VHNIGPSLILPILKAVNIKAIVTYHSANYEHQKWGPFSKSILKFGEKLAVAFADHIIFVSKTQAGKIKCKRKSHIPNGVEIFTPSMKDDYVKSLGLSSKNYVLAVTRFMPEKGVLDLVNAFRNTAIKTNLVICGDADHVSEYSTKIKKTAALDKRIILTGYITGDKLEQIYSQALIFILPSHYEGHPIALLEALSFKLPVLVSNIPPNIEIGLPRTCYFEKGNHEDIARMLELFFNYNSINTVDNSIRMELLQKYRWNKIANDTIAIYKKISLK